MTMRRLTMTAAEIKSLFRVGNHFINDHRGELGGIKCGMYVVFPVANVAEYFGVDKADVYQCLEE